jgi:hypothetical protein
MTARTALTVGQALAALVCSGASFTSPRRLTGRAIAKVVLDIGKIRALSHR